jgi:hypothetical protein
VCSQREARDDRLAAEAAAKLKLIDTEEAREVCFALLWLWLFIECCIFAVV